MPPRLHQWRAFPLMFKEMAMARALKKFPLVGNRMMLAGSLLYLLEWVGIIWTNSRGVAASVAIGTSAADLIPSFKGNETALTMMAGWFSLVLIGRILIIIGLKNALTASDRSHPIMEFAVVMMAMSVAFELLTYTFFATASHLGAEHPEGMVALEWTSGTLNGLVFGTVGVSVLSSSWAMLRSELFVKALPILGIVSGIALALSALFISPSLSNIGGALSSGAALFWIWMIWTGILLWKKAPSRTVTPA